MHDWTLLTISLTWKTGEVRIDFESFDSLDGQDYNVVSIFATEVRRLNIPNLQEWGLSVSVNSVERPVLLNDGTYKLIIEMQSGDNISIIAKKIVFPDLNK